MYTEMEEAQQRRLKPWQMLISMHFSAVLF